MALGLDDVAVGVWDSPGRVSGATVVLPPEGALAAVAVRGASPATREAIALGPHGKMTMCHAVVLSGGAAFGLAAADGAVRWLEEHGRGYPVGDLGVVPIVGAAVILDRSVAEPSERPGADAGYAACVAATAAEPAEGGVGAGLGASVAKIGGIEHGWRGGQGVSVRSSGDLVVGALVVNNALGEVLHADGTPLAASRAPADVVRFPEADLRTPGDDAALPSGGVPMDNTVIGVVVTNAKLDKSGAYRVADLGHSGIVRAVRPAHTQYDGDALFCIATQRVEAPLDLVAELAAEAVADAVRRGPLAATGHSDLPGLADAT